MKTKLFSVFLIFMLCVSLIACGDEEAKSVLDDENNAASETVAQTDAEDESEERVIPDAVLNLSEEDDRALTGVLTADSYTNEYFGLKFNRPEGGSIQSLMDGEGVTDIMPLSQTYTDAYGTIYIEILNAAEDSSVTVSIYATENEQLGISEEERIQDRVDMEKSVNESWGRESDTTKEALTIAGEEHPALVERVVENGTEMKNAVFYFLKNDFECMISIGATAEEFDSMLALIEKS